jgi:hypothetical protein
MINHTAKQVHITELFFMARVGEIWCSGLSRLSSVNTPTWARSMRAAWVSRVSSENLKRNDEFIDLEVLEKRVHRCTS